MIRPKVARVLKNRVDDAQLPDLLIIWNWQGRVIAGVFVLANAFMAWSLVESSRDMLIAVLSIVAMVLAAAVLTTRHHVRLPLPLALIALSLGIGMLGLATLQADIPNPGHHANWHIGAYTMILMILTLRRQMLLGWFGYLVLIAFELFHLALRNEPMLNVVPLVSRHFGSLAVTTAAAWGLVQIQRLLVDVEERRRTLRAIERVREAAEGERVMLTTRIDRLAGQMLRRIADGRPLTPGEQRESLLVEASLRDTLSGGAWASDEVLSAARAARERGVHVTLLDDSRGAQSQWAIAAERVLDELQILQSGATCIARMYSNDRDQIASILITEPDGQSRTIEVLADSEVGYPG